MGYKDKRDEARREWVDRLMKLYRAREAAPDELELFGGNCWNAAAQWGVEYALSSHPEVSGLRQELEVLKERVEYLEELFTHDGSDECRNDDNQ